MREKKIKNTQKNKKITLAIFCYNQQEYVAEAIIAAFQQDYNPLEIVISDDHSTDNTFEIIVELTKNYKGPHQIKIRRSETNQGVLNHIIDATEECSGEIIVMAAGDDISYPNRVTELAEAFTHPDTLAVSSHDHIIDKSGKISFEHENRISQMESLIKINKTWIHGATSAYRTQFLKMLFKPDYKVFYEDTTLADIIKVLGKKTVLIRKPLVQYRYHDRNLSDKEQYGSVPEKQEEKAILRWENFCTSKRYVIDFIKNAPHKEHIDKLSFVKIIIEYKFLALLKNWKNLKITEKFLLIFYSAILGQIHTAAPRILSPNYFFKLKKSLKISHEIK